MNRLDEVLEEFDAVIGLDKLRAIHLNDSMNGPGSHKDRHAKIGQGNIGLDAFQNIVNHPKFCPGYSLEFQLQHQSFQ